MWLGLALGIGVSLAGVSCKPDAACDLITLEVQADGTTRVSNGTTDTIEYSLLIEARRCTTLNCGIYGLYGDQALEKLGPQSAMLYGPMYLRDDCYPQECCPDTGWQGEATATLEVSGLHCKLEASATRDQCED